MISDCPESSCNNSAFLLILLLLAIFYGISFLETTVPLFESKREREKKKERVEVYLIGNRDARKIRRFCFQEVFWMNFKVFIYFMNLQKVLHSADVFSSFCL